MAKQDNTPLTPESPYDMRRNNPRHEVHLRRFKGQPQFTLDQLYIPPFNYERSHTQDGRIVYQPIEVDRHPTGIHILDDLLCQLTDNTFNLPAFCASYGARITDLDALIFLLTGLRSVEFRQSYQLRLSDDLLRYTSLSVVDVALRSGFGSRVNLYYAYKFNLRTSPTARRERLRQEGDEDRYRIEI